MQSNRVDPAGAFTVACNVALTVALAGQAFCAQASSAVAPPPVDSIDLSLEPMSSLTVTSVSGRAEDAAQYAITYTAIDARLADKLSRDLELSLLGQNLPDRRHVEFNVVGVASQIERCLLIKAI